MSYGSDASIKIERNRRLQIFRPPYEMLVSLVSPFFGLFMGRIGAGEGNLMSFGASNVIFGTPIEGEAE